MSRVLGLYDFRRFSLARYTNSGQIDRTIGPDTHTGHVSFEGSSRAFSSSRSDDAGGKTEWELNEKEVYL